MGFPPMAEGPPDGPAGHAPPSAQVLSAVTKGVLGVHSDLLGRGATRARTDWAGDDVLVCVLEDCLTRAEQTLAAAGRHEAIRAGRRELEPVLAERLCAVVAESTGREVAGSLSQISVDPPVAVEVFLLGR